ncbi:LysR family substrate-binding domain-containing protein [Nonomuraea angiospora]|uniref:LysR family substrate-binding domain-containing protein n=1 Tax=Nonomuraea angiospora TaxID=46172 RepID=UPI00298F05E1|nr:LysR family substrate-binding domain-containing protein [Nonomuraea angiospora]
MDDAREAARGVRGTLTLGTVGPHSLAFGDIIGLFEARNPGVRLQHREIQPPSPLDLIRSGEVDVAVLWLPMGEPGLTAGPVVSTSPVLLMVSATHPYAGRDSICLEDLGDCAVVQGQRIPQDMEETFNPYRTPAGRPVRRGPKVSTWQEALTAVASGRAVAGVTVDVADFYPWPSLAFVPIRDAPPCQWALVWRTAADNPLIHAFARAATDIAAATGDPSVS